MCSHPCTAHLFILVHTTPVHTYSHPCTSHLEKPGTTSANSYTCTTHLQKRKFVRSGGGGMEAPARLSKHCSVSAQWVRG